MRFYLTAIFSIFFLYIFSRQPDNREAGPRPLTKPGTPEAAWVDSVFSALTPEQRIAQLFMVAAYSNRSMADNKEITELVRDFNVGGIIFFQGGPLRQADMTNQWQAMAKTPLLVAIDGEWGLGMRLKDSCISFPKQMTLGAIRDSALVYEMGKEIARECRRIGVTVNFAPDVDVNSNPRNPVINYRSFGEDPRNVAKMGIAYMKGMQDHGVMASAKHFPGHGDTDKDSHYTLPVINHDRARLDSIDLYPFRELISQGVGFVMVAHLFVPALDDQKQATTLSSKVISGLLKGQMGYKGVVITDALGMDGFGSPEKPGDLEVKALKAGVDILLMPKDTKAAITAIKLAIQNGELKQESIDEKCKKVLALKHKLGLYKNIKVKKDRIYEDLHTAYADWLQRCLYESSLTLIKNNDSLLPLRHLDSLNIACISLGADSTVPVFQTIMDNYARVSSFRLPKNADDSDYEELRLSLAPYNIIIIGVHSSSNSISSNYGINGKMIAFIKSLAVEKKVVLDLFANPYALLAFGDMRDIPAILVSYQNHDYAQIAGAEGIFGGIAINGRLPVTACAQFPVNTSYCTSKIRLKYTVPEDAGLRPDAFVRVDSIAQKGVIDSVYPGCQILIAVKGKVVYQKSFGYHTYEHKDPVRNSDLYDLASITKIAATTISVMKLYEEGKIKLDDELAKYLPEVDSSNKEHIIIRQMMAHQARLKPFIPFYQNLMKNGTPDTNVFRSEKSAVFPYRVAENLYIRWDYPDTLFQTIIKSDLRDHSGYRYSDLGFYFMKKIVERTANEAIDEYVYENFYRPLGLTTMCYQPRNYFDINRIVPSERDTFFRKQILDGDVNDPGAAMCGGIQGHAGLFSNSNDLAILLQMLIQGGEYGGERYYKAETVKEFTSYQFKNNRRGLGFDKPVPDREGGPTCKAVSDESFGHSGFTGTYVWADPKYQIVYVFLSNRTYPYSENNKLLESGIRTEIQSAIYKAVE
jgi:beta-glucosidase-like glycosyl hydrolase/CubicO group peptidase (beta-lactamase class C family)